MEKIFNAPKRARGRPKAFDPAPEQTTVQALDRALLILKALAAADGGLSLTEIAEATGQAPATVYRALSTFALHGIVETQGATQLWFIGPEAFRIGNAFLGRSGLVEQARRAMRELMARTGETANLAVADGSQVIFLSQVETHHPIRAFFRPGTRGPIHAAGIGKALLAYATPEQVARLLGDAPLEAYTPRTITDRAALDADLAASRARGWAMDDEERTEGMRCVAAPIFNEFREPVAGISISGPTVRVTPDRAEAIGAEVRAAADRVTRALGGTPA
ncbi:HTH-type transcriptional regulator BhcR [Amaricoccus solimangrovi]|uniref:IclR family transcriptional regulator n=1 Tax=Amaricoccus solimangrovi TaxID=2589815 RepID=A0A501WYU0_9RHOB|nr:HTH-type transcriptional regulator BhcR [Amaricoccus solimangrovi]TPE52757.1 IclR family transcriptional regulator [Amaricoccus solimangrovi]